ncbi:hypothetical protein N9L68_03290 [bacterium]|nr:hypothetical protein [bacterium]
MLPCAEYPANPTRSHDDDNVKVFVAGDYFNAHPTQNIFNTEVENVTDSVGEA